MKHIKHKLLLAGIVSLTMLTSTASAVDPVLTDTQLHAVLGVVTNFILDDGDTANNSTLKKTGQTQSYDAAGTVVTDGSQKDDGFYQKGVDHNYTRDAGNEIVTDHITGLQWQDDLAAKTVQKQWLETITYQQCTGTNGQTLDATQCSVTAGDTATTYCTNLTLGGHTDWRLPTRKELVSLSDYGQIGPAMDATFQNTASSYYWSSTTYVGNVSSAWRVYFGLGTQYYIIKSNGYYVRCVRAGDAVPPPDFTKTGNIVTDNSTGLQWQDDTLGASMNWQAAIDYCEALSLDGFNDWRLPNLKELTSIVDDSTSSPAIESTFQNTTSYYWSSTTYLGNVSRAWTVGSGNGNHSNNPKSNGNSVRCVRAGE